MLHLYFQASNCTDFPLACIQMRRKVCFIMFHGTLRCLIILQKSWHKTSSVQTLGQPKSHFNQWDFLKGNTSLPTSVRVGGLNIAQPAKISSRNENLSAFGERKVYKHQTNGLSVMKCWLKYAECIHDF